MMTAKHTDIIPIRYMSGTGGQFLSNFITAAKNNDKSDMYLSYYGNAYENNLLDFSLNYAFGPKDDDLLKIQALLNLKGKEGAVPVYYPPAMHVMDIELLLNTFDKVISITYDIEDVFDIAIVFYGKFFMDESRFDDVSKHHLISKKIALNRTYNTFKPYLSDKVLNISWKEFLHLDTDIMIDKTSLFTDIPKENFNISNLLEWRNATINCLDEIRNTLNT